MSTMIETAELPLEEPTKNGKKSEPLTTGAVLDLIETRFSDRGEHVVLFDVPNIVGMQQARRCDAVAIGMWKRSGYLIHGFEVKVSRGDWLRELKDTSKADPFMSQVDRWWLVTGDIDIAKPLEIPEYWGWMNASKTGLRVQRPPKALNAEPQPETMRRAWAYALIQRAEKRSDEQLERHRQEIEKQVTTRLELDYSLRSKDHWQRNFEKLQAEVTAFEAASGMPINSWKLGSAGNVGKLAKLIRDWNFAGYKNVATTLKRHIEDLQSLQDRTKAVIDGLDSPMGEPDDDL